MSLSALPDLSFGFSDQKTSGANGNWFGGMPGSMADSFDHSAWNVSIGSSGNLSATGSTGQGASAPAPQAGITAAIKPEWLLIAGLAFILLRGK
jgi:hypothetical protein